MFSSVLNFFRDIGNFFKLKQVVGIDIGTVSVKLIEATRKGDRLEIKNYGLLETKDYLERGNAAIQSGSLKMVPSQTAALINTIIRETGVRATHVIASLPISAVFTVVIEMPLLNEKETARSIPFQARQYIPMSIQSVALEWTKIDEYKNEKGQPLQRVFITAVPKELIREYHEVFRTAGLTLSSLEVDVLALVRAIGSPNDPPTLIVDMGGLSTAVLVTEKGVIKQISQSDYGGATLTHAIAKALGVSTWRAEELKRRRGLRGFSGEYELSTSLLPFLDVIIRECERVRGLYERGNDKKIETLMLTGGGALLETISEYFTNQLQLSLREPSPLRHFTYPASLEPLMKVLNKELGIAAGLALRARL